ncbi:carbohydrate ABC transporter permease (plasmid) [Haloterrigena salifodinae]|uniref:Carbohydrate ABC transporter permease n=1 Tax=Haloterrigena salifodinae TaxID=2675099 RepID=A0A8T8E7E0_9EURY|nr:carbohydrate ABC transporter permease [Haloterrigena salifodinae]QRV17402.1 carbohydrate ABC transporter permease [Haloterrigena salifodinae]
MADVTYPGYDRSGTTYRVKRILLYVVLTLGAIWWAIPFWWTLATSLAAQPSAATILPDAVTFDHYRRLWESVPLVQWFINTLIFAGCVTAFNLTFDSLAGYALAKIDFWGREKLFLAFLSTMMVPGMVILIPTYLIITELGLVNTYPGLILPLAAQPFGIFLLRQHFKDLPSSLGDAAKMDGCNELQIFYKIYLPMAKPAIATLGIFTFMTTWNNFQWPLIIANDEAMYTLPVAIYAVQGQYATEWGLIMAAATIIVLPVIAVFLSAQKYFIRGMSLGGMKG